MPHHRFADAAGITNDNASEVVTGKNLDRSVLCFDIFHLYIIRNIQFFERMRSLRVK